jgi:hypothetical protein
MVGLERFLCFNEGFFELSSGESGRRGKLIAVKFKDLTAVGFDQ